MRKVLVWITVVTLIVSVVGTGVLVYFDVSTPLPDETNSLTTEENAK